MSNVNIDISDADYHELDKQVEDTITFFKAEARQIRRLCEWPSVEGVTLDFGFAWRDVFAQCDHPPAELVRLAGALELRVKISHHPVSDDSTDEPGTDNDDDESAT